MAPGPGEGDATWYLVPGKEASPTDCQHASLALLGADAGNNEFYRCEDCENVLIKEGSVDYRTIRDQRESRTEQRWGGRPTAGGSERRPTGSPRSDIVDQLLAFGRRLLGRR